MFKQHRPLAATATGADTSNQKDAHSPATRSCCAGAKEILLCFHNHNRHQANAHGMDGTRKECPLHLPHMQGILCIHRTLRMPNCNRHVHDTFNRKPTRITSLNPLKQPRNKPQDSIEFVSTPHAQPKLGEFTRLMQTMLPGECVPSACNAVLPAPCKTPASTVSYNPNPRPQPSQPAPSRNHTLRHSFISTAQRHNLPATHQQRGLASSNQSLPMRVRKAQVTNNHKAQPGAVAAAKQLRAWCTSMYHQTVADTHGVCQEPALQALVSKY